MLNIHTCKTQFKLKIIKQTRKIHVPSFQENSRIHYQLNQTQKYLNLKRFSTTIDNVKRTTPHKL